MMNNEFRRPVLDAPASDFLKTRVGTVIMVLVFVVFLGAVIAGVYEFPIDSLTIVGVGGVSGMIFIFLLLARFASDLYGLFAATLMLFNVSSWWSLIDATLVSRTVSGGVVLSFLMIQIFSLLVLGRYIRREAPDRSSVIMKRVCAVSVCCFLVVLGVGFVLG